MKKEKVDAAVSVLMERLGLPMEQKGRLKEAMEAALFWVVEDKPVTLLPSFCKGHCKWLRADTGGSGSPRLFCCYPSEKELKTFNDGWPLNSTFSLTHCRKERWRKSAAFFLP